jgi:hypothetical protein
MGFRFRRSIKLFPGTSQRQQAGVSTSIGKRGATVSIRGDRVRGAVGIPRTGRSCSEQSTQRVGSGAQMLTLWWSSRR